MIDRKRLAATFREELAATRSVEDAVMAVANQVLAYQAGRFCLQRPRIGPERSSSMSESLTHMNIEERCQQIIAHVAKDRGVPVTSLFNKLHGWKRLAHERWICAYLMRRYLEMKVEPIAKRLMCHHTSVVLGIESLMADSELMARAERIWGELNAHRAAAPSEAA